MGLTSTTTTSTTRTTVRDVLSGRFLQELTQRGGEIPERRRADNFMMRCPLPNHAERTPSFHLTLKQDDLGRELWIAKCFGCPFEGDDVDLLAALDNQAVADWMRLYLERNGELDLPAPRPTRPVPPAKEASTGCSAEDLNAYLDSCHAALLQGQDSAGARRYCRDRGLRSEEVRRWKIGVGLPPGKLGFSRKVAGRLVLPVPGVGFEARAIDGSDPKYLTVGGKRPPWGLDTLEADTSPLLIVEGILDAVACRRVMDDDNRPVNHNTIALRSQSIILHPDDAQRLAEFGFRDAYIGLDRDAKPDFLDRTAYQLFTVGIRPHFIRGPANGDWGDMLKLDDDALVAAFGGAVRLA